MQIDNTRWRCWKGARCLFLAHFDRRPDVSLCPLPGYCGSPRWRGHGDNASFFAAYSEDLSGSQIPTFARTRLGNRNYSEAKSRSKQIVWRAATTDWIHRTARSPRIGARGTKSRMILWATATPFVRSEGI